MKKNNGFTLIEVLAVIAILGLILIIAVPKINETMNESKAKSLIISARTIAEQAEKIYMENYTLGKSTNIECSEVTKLSSDNYGYCKILFDENGKAKVTLEGKGKFEGMAICDGTKKGGEISEHCFTDEACFAHGNVELKGDFTINEDACKTFAISDGAPVEVAEVVCDGGTYEGMTLSDMINEGWYSIEDLEDAGVIVPSYENYYAITGYDYENPNCSSNVWIPDKINGIEIEAIADYAFTTEGEVVSNAVSQANVNFSSVINMVKSNLCNSKLTPISAAPELGIGITGIKLSSTIEYIGEAAFIDSNITGTLDLSDATSLLTIGEAAFYGNTITTLILPSSVEKINAYAFYNEGYDDSACNYLRKIDIGNKNATIDSNAFGCICDASHNLPSWFELCGR